MFNLLIPSIHSNTGGNTLSDETQLTILEVMYILFIYVPILFSYEEWKKDVK